MKNYQDLLLTFSAVCVILSAFVFTMRMEFRSKTVQVKLTERMNGEKFVGFNEHRIYRPFTAMKIVAIALFITAIILTGLYLVR